MHKAINAKFKKGDRVVSSDGKYHGVVWDVYGGGEIAVKCEEDDPLTRRRFDQNCLKLANCSTANSVVARAVANARAMNFMPGEKFKVGQKVYYKDGPFQSLGTIEAVVGSKYKIKDYHTNRVIEMRGDDIAYAVNSSAEPTVAKNEFDIWGSRKAEMAEIRDIGSFEDREFSKLESDLLSVVDRIEGKWTACKERMLKKATSSSGVAKSDLMRIASVCEEGRDRMIRARKLSGKLFG